jgi:6-phosphogluconolactonase
MPSVLNLISEFTSHDTKLDMAGVLTRQITQTLAEALEARGHASLAVSGGSTPKMLYEILGMQDLDWSKVTIVLVDDRWVEPGLAGSNESFVRKTLMSGRASIANFVGLKTKGETPHDGLAEARTRVATVNFPLDVVVLGLGNDGHTASWFPNASGLSEALEPLGEHVSAIDAAQSQITGPFTQRITLTRAAFANAGAIHVMFAGEKKRKTWAKAQGPGRVEEMPIRALIRDPNIALNAHWSA